LFFKNNKNLSVNLFKPPKSTIFLPKYVNEHVQMSYSVSV